MVPGFYSCHRLTKGKENMIKEKRRAGYTFHKRFCIESTKQNRKKKKHLKHKNHIKQPWNMVWYGMAGT